MDPAEKKKQQVIIIPHFAAIRFEKKPQLMEE